MKAKQHYSLQRISALIVGFCLFVFLFALQSTKFAFIKTTCFFLIFFSLFHGLLGLEVICEDYITNLQLRKFTILTIRVTVYTAILLKILTDIAHYV